MRIQLPFSSALRACALLAGLGFAVPALAATCPSLLDQSFRSLDTGKPVNLCRYAGKVILVVNTASH